MRIALDMDGTITEGRFLEPPRTREAYMSLAPYDNDTMDILYDIMAKHEVFIITARSEPRADIMIRQWLATNKSGSTLTALPTAIITNPIVGRKNPENAIWKRKLCDLLGIDILFDDSPNVYKQCCWDLSTYLMDNPHWPENQTLQVGVDFYNKSLRLNSWKGILETINDQ